MPTDKSSATTRVGRLLIVEDHPTLREQVRAAVASRADVVVCAADVAAACRAIEDAVRDEVAIDLVLLDVALPDGTAFDVLDALAVLPVLPVIIAMSGSASPPESFKLAERGVRAYVEKPVSLEKLYATIDTVLATPPSLAPHVRGMVGHASLEQIEDGVRDALVDEALSRAGGSKHGAARLLEITRQRLQHILRKRE